MSKLAEAAEPPRNKKFYLKKIWRIKNFAENLHNNLIGHGTKI